MGKSIVGGRVFTYYRARIELRDKLLGGIPLDPGLMAAWIRKNAGVSQQLELQQMVERTMAETGMQIPEDATFEQLMEASDKVAALKQTCGFKKDTIGGLYVESRYIKSMIRECTSVLFAGDTWGKTRKSAINYVRERVFVSPDRLYLGANEPDGVEFFVGHIDGPKGPRSTLKYHQFFSQPALEFEIASARDCVSTENFYEIWEHAQENGLGAMRSQGFGRFDLTEFEVIRGPELAKAIENMKRVRRQQRELLGEPPEGEQDYADEVDEGAEPSRVLVGSGGR